LALGAASGMRQLPDSAAAPNGLDRHPEANASRSPGAAISRGEIDTGRLVGAVYAANTVGAIIGAAATSIWLIPMLGTQHVQQLLVLVSALAALTALAPLLFPLAVEGHREANAFHPPRAAIGRRVTGGVALIGCLAAVWWLSEHVPPTPGALIAEGRYLPYRQRYYPPEGNTEVRYQGEGMNSSVAVTEQSDGTINFHVSGKVEASTQPQDMRLQRMLGHIPALVHPRPRTVLVVGCGAGVTAGTFLAHPEVERVVICELEPLIPQRVAPFFGPQNYDVVKNPKVEIVYDDARHYILTTRE
jgi:spermidine synthase